MKNCSRCKESKNDSEFYKDKRSSDGLNCACKLCVNSVNKKWQADNPQKAGELRKKYKEKYRENAREYAKEYQRKKRLENPQELRKKKKNWEKKNPEKVRAIRRKAYKKFYLISYDKVKEGRKKWIQNNPEKITAHRKICYAVRKREIIKPEKCQMCSKNDKLNAHHHDYSRPLDVIWLCYFCHAKVHHKDFKEIP